MCFKIQDPVRTDTEIAQLFAWRLAKHTGQHSTDSCWLCEQYKNRVVVLIEEHNYSFSAASQAASTVAGLELVAGW